MLYRAKVPILIALIMAACQDSPSEPLPAPRALLIAFVSARDGNNEIYTMPASGTDAAGKLPPTRLTTNAGIDGAPDLSSDGRQIVFHSVRPEHTNSEIYVMDADGLNQRRLTNDAAGSFFPSFSPDRSKIVFVRGVAPVGTTRGTRQIWVIDANGTNARQLTSEGDNYRPRWSPDGRRIVVSSDRDGDFVNAVAREKGANFGLHDIYTMNADGTNVLRLTSIRTSLNGEPVYSPSGGQIAFRSRREKDKNGDNYCALWVMNADGTSPRNLTPIPADLTFDKWCNAFPAWSPDNQQIVFHALRPTEDFGVQIDIYAVDVQTLATTRLTQSAAAEQTPSVR